MSSPRFVHVSPETSAARQALFDRAEPALPILVKLAEDMDRARVCMLLTDPFDRPLGREIRHLLPADVLGGCEAARRNRTPSAAVVLVGRAALEGALKRRLPDLAQRLDLLRPGVLGGVVLADCGASLFFAETREHTAIHPWARGGQA